MAKDKRQQEIDKLLEMARHPGAVHNDFTPLDCEVHVLGYVTSNICCFSNSFQFGHHNTDDTAGLVEKRAARIPRLNRRSDLKDTGIYPLCRKSRLQYQSLHCLRLIKGQLEEIRTKLLIRPPQSN